MGRAAARVRDVPAGTKGRFAQSYLLDSVVFGSLTEMKAVVALVCALALMACVAQASDVVVLTDETFDETIKNHEFVLVEFFVCF